LNYQIDKYYHHKISLGKLLKENNLETMSKDFEVIDRIFNILTENKSTNKIKGIISTTQILKYGGDIEESKTKSIYNQILNWFECINL